MPAQSLDTLKNNVFIFLHKYITSYIIGDLKALEKIKPDSDGFGACAVPTAMAVLSAMDLLGFLLDPDGNTDKSANNIFYYIKFQDENNNRIFPSYYDDALEKLKNYRHGMMHHFFPKLKGKFAGINKNPEHSDLFLPHPKIGESDAESLNAYVLQKDFQKSVISIEQILKRSDDYNLFLRIVNRLKDFEFNLILEHPPITTQPPGTPQNRG